ncbi:MAG TPA: bifunctional riboflavin kinase/FAD synthetase [Gammaproteobacteria bacterium]|nr:bifunctional riboflavin kinase/FAD synthetase [Gammaproteobacteria bacterium]
MKIIRGLHNLPTAPKGTVVTIGNFDGVHLGHQAILGQLAERAAELGLPTVVVTFEPHPLEFFRPGLAPPRLTRFREKMHALTRYSVDRVVVLSFNTRLAAMPAVDFIEQVLIAGLNVRYLVVGDDFRFGHRRAGDFDMLKRTGVARGFQVAAMHSFCIDGERVSSTRIRAALGQDDLATAEKLLGRPYRMCGRVAHGDRRGRQLGFPTANIHLHRVSAPVQGVYAVEVFGLDPEPLAGVANVGNRPTVGGMRSQLEVHLLDFDQDIYGRYVHVDFLHKIRPEQRFAGVGELTAQIQRDVATARDFHMTRAARQRS